MAVLKADAACPDVIAAAAWPAGRLGEAVEALARRAGLALADAEVLVPPAGVQRDSAGLDRWLIWAGEQLGVAVDAVETTPGGLTELLEAAGPAILKLAGSGGFLLLLPRKFGQLRLLTPDLVVARIAEPVLRQALLQPFERPHEPTVATLLDRIGASGRRRDEVRRLMMDEKIAGQRLSGVWLVRLAATAPFRQHLGEAGILASLTQMIGLFVVLYGLEIAGWGVIGRAALDGRSDWGWLMAWALLILSLIPLKLFGRVLDARLSIGLGRLFKARLLVGGLRLDLDQVRHEGVGRMLSRVMESQAFEAIAVHGGFAAMVAVLELGLAAWILSLGAGGVLHVLLLVAWLVLAAVLATAYAFSLFDWTARRLKLTQTLVERMVGHRTLLAQDRPERRERQDDHALSGYLAASARMDRAGLPFLAGIPAGWMIVGLLGLAPAYIASSAGMSGLAVSLGGILLAGRAFEGIAGGLAAAARAVIAWREIRPLFHAAAQRPAARPFLPDAENRQKAGTPLIDGEGLSFAYDEGRGPILSSASLSIRHGERLLLEGASGGGKSTLAALLVGLRQPQSGLLLINGLDRHSLGDDWHRYASEAPQFHDNHILSGTLAFNLLMGRRWPADEADIAEARGLCEALGLGELIARMPSGMMQTVGETGWQLSHGEKSRIFLARALLQQADLTILDESFAALDPETRDLCMKTVLSRARTLMVVAHP